MGGDGQALLNKRKIATLERNLSATEHHTAPAAVVRQNAFRHCALSHQPLRSVVCCDMAGRLYNKSAIVEMLLEKKQAKDDGLDLQAGGSSLTQHINKLKDVRELKLSASKAAEGEEEEVELVCPLTGVSSLSPNPFLVCLWRCGHVVAASEVNGTDDCDGAALLHVKCPHPDCVVARVDTSGDMNSDETVGVRLCCEEEESLRQLQTLRAVMKESEKSKKRARCPE